MREIYTVLVNLNDPNGRELRSVQLTTLVEIEVPDDDDARDADLLDAHKRAQAAALDALRPFLTNRAHIDVEDSWARHVTGGAA